LQIQLSYHEANKTIAHFNNLSINETRIKTNNLKRQSN